MKFMLIMNSPRDGYTQYMNWPRKILEANFAFMQSFTQKLADAGELVNTVGLASPEEAKHLGDRHAQEVNLLLSDVIMPGGTGLDVVAALRPSAPALRVLFMSGYTDHAVLRDAALQRAPGFIQKPFTPEALLKKVRAILDSQ